MATDGLGQGSEAFARNQNTKGRESEHLIMSFGDPSPSSPRNQAVAELLKVLGQPVAPRRDHMRGSASDGARRAGPVLPVHPHPPPHCPPACWPRCGCSSSLPAWRLRKSSSTQQRGLGRSSGHSREQETTDLPEGRKPLCSGEKHVPDKARHPPSKPDVSGPHLRRSLLKTRFHRLQMSSSVIRTVTSLLQGK